MADASTTPVPEGEPAAPAQAEPSEPPPPPDPQVRRVTVATAVVGQGCFLKVLGDNILPGDKVSFVKQGEDGGGAVVEPQGGDDIETDTTVVLFTTAGVYGVRLQREGRSFDFFDQTVQAVVATASCAQQLVRANEVEKLRMEVRAEAVSAAALLAALEATECTVMNRTLYVQVGKVMLHLNLVGEPGDAQGSALTFEGSVDILANNMETAIEELPLRLHAAENEGPVACPLTHLLVYNAKIPPEPVCRVDWLHPASGLVVEWTREVDRALTVSREAGGGLRATAETNFPLESPMTAVAPYEPNQTELVRTADRRGESPAVLPPGTAGGTFRWCLRDYDGNAGVMSGETPIPRPVRPDPLPEPPLRAHPHYGTVLHEGRLLVLAGEGRAYTAPYWRRWHPSWSSGHLVVHRSEAVPSTHLFVVGVGQDGREVHFARSPCSALRPAPQVSWLPRPMHDALVLSTPEGVMLVGGTPGGGDDSPASTTVLRCTDPRGRGSTWADVKGDWETPPLGACGGVSSEGDVYVFGGVVGDAATNDTYRLRRGIWTRVATAMGDIPPPTCDAAAVMLNDILYVIGGRPNRGDGVGPHTTADGFASVWTLDCRDPASLQWAVADGPRCRPGAPLRAAWAADHNVVYLVGADQLNGAYEWRPAPAQRCGPGGRPVLAKKYQFQPPPPEGDCFGKAVTFALRRSEERVVGRCLQAALPGVQVTELGVLARLRAPPEEAVHLFTRGLPLLDWLGIPEYRSDIASRAVEDFVAYCHGTYELQCAPEDEPKRLELWRIALLVGADELREAMRQTLRSNLTVRLAAQILRIGREVQHVMERWHEFDYSQTPAPDAARGGEHDAAGPADPPRRAMGPRYPRADVPPEEYNRGYGFPSVTGDEGSPEAKDGSPSVIRARPDAPAGVPAGGPARSPDYKYNFESALELDAARFLAHRRTDLDVRQLVADLGAEATPILAWLLAVGSDYHSNSEL